MPTPLRRGRPRALVSSITGLVLASTAAVAVAGATVAATATPAAASSPGVSYAVYPIASGLNGVQPRDINENGQVVGSYQKAPDQRLPFVWQNGQQEDLPLAPDTSGYITHGSAISINDAGLIGGWTTKDGGTWAATWQKQKDGAWSRRDIAETRGAFDEHGGISSVNNNGDLLLTYPAIKDGFSGEETVLMGGTDAVDLPRSTDVNEVVTAWELNDSAEVVGQRLNRDTDDVRTTTWVGGTGTGLPDGPDGQPGEGLAINSAGDVLTYMSQVGTDGTRIDHLDVLSADGVYRTIGDLPLNDVPPDQHLDAQHLWGRDMNDKGVVVGGGSTVWNGRLTYHAFVNRGGQTFDLNNLIPAGSGWELGEAYAVNNRGQIVGTGTFNGTATAFLLDPTRPVLFVPGAGASQLVSYDDFSNPTELWLGCGTDRNRLSLDPANPGDRDVRAVDALRYMTCHGITGHMMEALDAYGSFLDALQSQYGYKEYRVDGFVSRRTTAGCDMSQAKDNPNLFVFAYDWRQDNAASAKELADYVGCIRRLHPDQDIDIVTHSMGSLVARRYVLDTSPDSHVHQMITIGAPWLGAPKLVDVLNTGNFIKSVAQGSSDVIKKIAAFFPAEHELMAGPYYHQLAGPVFQERGWDFNGDGNPWESYDWAELQQVFDAKWDTHPATTAAAFQTFNNDYGGESDWSNDQTGIRYTHIVGVQAAATTIGKVDAVAETTCAIVCSTRHLFRDEFVRGDGTVPETSAARQTAGGADLNAPGADVIRFVSPSSGSDDTVEHTNLTHNPQVIETVVNRLRSDSAPAQGFVATKAATTTGPSAPMLYLSMVNGTDTYVTGPDNATTAFIDGSDVRQQINGVEHLVTGTGSEDVLLPMVADHGWTYHFTGTGEPISLALRVGDQANPDFVDRWRDIVVAKGQHAELAVSTTGQGTLRLDTDGDGQVDDVAATSAVLAGDDAADVDAPTVTITAAEVGGQRRYAVSADDAGSGVKRILVSADGTHFSAYTEPVAGSGTLHAFAEDWAGNRSGIVDIGVDALPVLPLTTATQTPAPSATGWTAGAANVALAATAPTGIKDITWSSTGAVKNAETTIAGDSASIDVAAAGTTIVRFRATGNDGSVEPWRTVQVRVDGHAPSGRILAPPPGSVVAGIDQIAGTAADDASGVASVDVALQRTSDGQWWNGTSWGAERTPVRAAGTAAWRTTAVPKGADLPEGGYAVRATVTDESGRSTVLGGSFVVRQSATYTVTPLASPSGAWDTSAQAIDDQGRVVGSAGVSADVRPVRWTNGIPAYLPVPDGSTGGRAVAVLGDGSIAGQAGTGSSGAAVRWSADGTVQALPVPSGATRTNAFGASPAGVAGSADDKTPVFWPASGGVDTLPNLAGGRGAANDADSRGTVVGYSNDGTYDRPVIWSGGKVRILGDLGGHAGYATAVNEVGQATGYGTDGGGRGLPFIADLNSGTIDPINIGVGGSANAINDSGTVVGEYVTSNASGAPHHAFSYRDGVAIDLNSLLPAGSGWVLIRAYSINDLGQIVGFGTKDGVGRAFLLSAEHTPDAEDVAVTTDAETPVPVALVGSDPDPGTTLGYQIVQSPGHGSLSTIQDGTVVYTPTTGYTGLDSFSYVADDGNLRSATATVAVTVQAGKVPPNQAPTAVVSAPPTTTEGTTVTFDAGASTDADGSVASYAWDLDGDGVFDDGTGVTATVAAKDDGTVTVAVRVTDDKGATATASAATTVTNVPPAVGGPGSVTTTAGTAWSATVSATDVPADTLSATVDYDDGTGPQAVTVANGTIGIGGSYADAGTHSVVIQVCDDDGGCGTHKITVTVQAPPPPPPIVGDGTAHWHGFVNVPGAQDRLLITGEMHVDHGHVQAALTVVRVGPDGAHVAALGLTKVTGGGVSPSDHAARLAGEARLVLGGRIQPVTVELLVRDNGPGAAAWLQVRRADGSIFADLSLPTTDGGVPMTLPLAGSVWIR